VYGRYQVTDRPPFAEAYAEAKLSEAARDAKAHEAARLTAVSYRTIIFDPVVLTLGPEKMPETGLQTSGRT
jgi:hypothetical protein